MDPIPDFTEGQVDWEKLSGAWSDVSSNDALIGKYLASVDRDLVLDLIQLFLEQLKGNTINDKQVLKTLILVRYTIL